MIAALTSNQINKYTINSLRTGALRRATPAPFVSRAFPAILLFSGHIDISGGDGGDGGDGGGEQMLFLIPTLAEWKVENALCSSTASLIAAAKTKVGNYDSKKEIKDLFVSLDDQSLIAVCHNRFPSVPPHASKPHPVAFFSSFPRNPAQSAVFCVALMKPDLLLCLRAVFFSTHTHRTERPSHRRLERTSLSCSVDLQTTERPCASTHFRGPSRLDCQLLVPPAGTRARRPAQPSPALHCMKREMKLQTHARRSIKTVARLYRWSKCAVCFQ